MPLRWAVIQTNLGNALTILGGRESGTARLEEAVAAYKSQFSEGAPRIYVPDQDLESFMLRAPDRIPRTSRRGPAYPPRDGRSAPLHFSKRLKNCGDEELADALGRLGEEIQLREDEALAVLCPPEGAP